MTNEENNFENDDIGQLLGSLKRVDAPGDFDVRVRARIAQGRPSVGRSWFPMPVRVTAAMLVMLAAGYFGFRSFYSPAPAPQQASILPMPQVGDQTVAERREPSIGPDVIPPNKEETNDPMAGRPPETRTPREIESAVKGAVTRTVLTKRGSGSRADALGISPVITAPDHTRHLTKEVLSGLGIDANNVGSGWTVGEVKQNSRAERSGLRQGDVIDTVKGSNVRVRREGKIVQVQLKP